MTWSSIWKESFFTLKSRHYQICDIMTWIITWWIIEQFPCICLCLYVSFPAAITLRPAPIFSSNVWRKQLRTIHSRVPSFVETTQCPNSRVFITVSYWRLCSKSRPVHLGHREVLSLLPAPNSSTWSLQWSTFWSLIYAFNCVVYLQLRISIYTNIHIIYIYIDILT